MGVPSRVEHKDKHQLEQAVGNDLHRASHVCSSPLRFPQPADGVVGHPAGFDSSLEPVEQRCQHERCQDHEDHERGVLLSQPMHDVYSTLEPQAAFHKRITFCLNVHNDAVKAMSYPPDAHKGELADAEVIKQRQLEEQELAEALAEEDYE